MMSNLFWLNDEQIARLQPFFPKSHGKQRVDDRRVLSEITVPIRRREKLRVARIQSLELEASGDTVTLREKREFLSSLRL